MIAEHQGHGSYTYECRKQDCWHCEHYGLKPLPEIWEPSPLPVFIPRTIKKKKPSKQRLLMRWSKIETELIIKNIWMNNKELTFLLPGRTQRAIYNRIAKLRRMSILPRY